MNQQAEVRDPEWLWRQIRGEGVALSQAEPMLASFFHASLLEHTSLASALAFLLAHKLGDRDMPAMSIREVCAGVYRGDAGVVVAGAADICAHFDRDPACVDYATPLLHYKGFQALQAYRVAHALWLAGRRSLALFLQYRITTVFDVDIHPAAAIGSGIMIDHATGVVIGETAIIGDNVRIYQAVTLGARHFPTDDEGNVIKGDARHPIVEDDVVIYAGATILGRITIGHGSTIGGNVWLTKDVPPNSVVTQATARNTPAAP